MVGSKRSKLSTILVDLLVLSQLTRFFIFLGGVVISFNQWLLLLALLLSAVVTYLFIPKLLTNKTLGMKLMRLRFAENNPEELYHYLTWRLFFNLVSNLVLLGIPLAINLFLLLWSEQGTTIGERLFPQLQVTTEE